MAENNMECPHGDRRQSAGLASDGERKHQDPRTMVDDFGMSGAEFSSVSTEVLQVIESTVRFRVFVTEADVDAQYTRRFKLLEKVSFTQCNPSNEAQFEDWVDEAACQVSRFQLCVGLFQEAWATVVPAAYARKVASIPLKLMHEELVDEVAKLFFQVGGYVQHLEKVLFYPTRAATVLDARNSVEDQVARFARLCNRWGYPMALPDKRVIEIALSTLPRDREVDVRTHMVNPTLAQVWERAARQEDIRRWLPAEYGANKENALPAEERAADGEAEEAKEKGQAGGKRSKPCVRCNKTTHSAKNCPKRDYRCYKCGMIGHLSVACRNTAIKDEKGRVMTRFEDKPSGTVLKNMKDRSQKDRMITAEAAIIGVREAGERKNQRAAAKRTEKAAAAGRTAKRRKIEHPAGVAQESAEKENDEEEPDLTEEEGDSECGLVGLESCLGANKAQSSVVRVHARVNGVQHELIADTGASKSLCSRATMKSLSLRKQNGAPNKVFSGLCDLEGIPMEPVAVEFENAKCDVQFFVLSKENLPTLLGKSDLTKLGVLIDPARDKLLNANTLEPVNLASEKSNAKALDTITQKAAGASDDELRAEAKQLVFEKSKHLQVETQEELWAIFCEFEEVWLRPKVGGAHTYAADFKVDGGPIKSKLRHLTPELQAELDKQLTAMLEAGVIQPSKSAWGAAPVFVKKSDGGWRLCLDYRHLNKRMMCDRYPIPLLWQQVQRAAGFRYYVTIDLNWGFWNLPLAPSSRHYTALVTHRGLFEFTVVPFGIKNSPPEFQRMMDGVLSDLLHERVICYVDDIVIYGDDIQEVLNLLRRVLKRLKENGLVIKLAKTALLEPEVLVLGHIVNARGIWPNPRKVQGIREAKIPKCQKEMKSFLGSVGFIRRFIPDCSTLIAPLTRLTKKHVAFKITNVEKEAFKKLQEIVSEYVLLNAPRGEGEFVITCDASDYGVGAALMQMQGDELAVLEFASKTLNKTERNWSTYEKEAFAIRWAVERFEDYIKTTGATVLTDHKSLEWIANATSGKVRRWALYLQQFNLTIQHISGETNHIADWLSRSQCEDDPFNDDESLAVPLFLGEEKERLDEECLGPGSHVTGYPRVPTYLEILKATEVEGESADVRETFRTEDGMRYSTRTQKLYVPKTLRESFIYWTHGSRHGGHQGVNKTVRRLRKWVWWPSLNGDVASYVQGCLICQRMHAPPRRLVLTYVLEKPSPFELISLDCVGPRSWWGVQKYYLSVIDHASRFVVTSASDSAITTAFVIEVLKEKWLASFCVPYAILTDRGSEFTSKEFRTFALKELGCALVNSSPYYPQGNAINEASHKAIDAVLKASHETFEDKFEDVLRCATQIHNACPHSATGQTPFYLLFGMEPTLPGWQGLQPQQKDAETRSLRVLENRGRALARQRLLADEQLVVTKQHVKVGDWVVYLQGAPEVAEAYGSTHKYAVPWSLPAKVLEVNDKVCRVEDWHTRKVRQVPLTLVRKLQGEIPPSLRALNEANLQRVMPKRARQVLEGPSESWDEWLRKKRPRPSGDESSELQPEKKQRANSKSERE